MNILILTGKFGMGHWSAARSLRQELLQAFSDAGIDIEDLLEYAMPNGSKAVYEAFQLLVTYGSGLFNTYYKLTENAPADSRSPFEMMFLEKLSALLAEHRPDAVIATHPFCAQLMSRYKAESLSQIPLVTCVTDLSTHSEWINSGTDCYLVGSEEIRSMLAAKGVDRTRVFVTGIPVRPEFKCLSYRRGGSERHLLIMGGGLGLLPRKDEFYEELNALPGVRTTIICGGNRKLYQRLHGKYPGIDVVGYTDRVYEYMASADLMLSKPGGITMFETIFAELPILAWEPFLEQEKKNAEFLLRRGMGRVAAKEPEDCLVSIRSLIYDDRALGRMSQRMREMKGRLQQESVEHILSALAQPKGACA